MTKFSWLLMGNNINQTDKNALTKFIKTLDKFTNDKKAKIFEKKQSK